MEGNRIRVVSLVTNLVIGGDANRLLNFGRTLDRSRFEHTVLTLVPPDHERNVPLGLMLPAFQRHKIPVETLGEEPRRTRRQTQRGMSLLWSDAVSTVRLIRRLADYFRQHRVDVIDARLTYATFFGVIAGRLAQVPVIVSTYYGPDDDWEKGLRYLIAQGIYSQLDALISDSNFSIDTFQRWCLRRHKQAVAVPNGIFEPVAERSRAEVRRFFNLREDVRVVCQVSRLISYKGHRVLLAAAKRILEQVPDVAFLLCGHSHPPAYIDELRRLTSELGITDHVRIGGYPGPIGDVWRAVDVHVHASLIDSSPIAIHESMALGLPAVVTNVGGIPELVRDGETALVVPSGDDQALANALLRILRDPFLERSLGAQAKQRFSEHYQAESMTRALEHLFLGLVANRRGLVPKAA